MNISLSNVEEVVKKTVKDGKITGLTDWNGREVKIIIYSNKDDQDSEED